VHACRVLPLHRWPLLHCSCGAACVVQVQSPPLQIGVPLGQTWPHAPQLLMSLPLTLRHEALAPVPHWVYVGVSHMQY
jgi:hypothetical protein